MRCRAFTHEELARVLRLASISYLALPAVLFLTGWLKLHWAVPALGCLVTALLPWIRLSFPGRESVHENEPFVAWGWTGVVTGILVTTILVALTGSGGIRQPTWDWFKHHAILKDLIDLSWPVGYAMGKNLATLTYYIAYYLPAAVIGKLAGWQAANAALFVWTVTGACLALGWLVVLSRAAWWWCLGMLILFSGMDVLGELALNGLSDPWRWFGNFDLEWWGRYFTLPSNVTLIAYAPHQGVSGWLLTGLLIDGMRRDPINCPYALIGSLSLLWSPFLTVGLMFLAAVVLLQERMDWQRWVKGLSHWSQLAALPVGLLLTLYFASRALPLKLPHWVMPSAQEMARSSFKFLPGSLGAKEFFPAYAGFVLMEFAVLAVLVLMVIWKRQPKLRRMLLASGVMLLVLPLFSYGHYNDLVMRVSIPSLFVLQVGVLAALATPQAWRSLAGLGVAGCLLIGAVYPANMLRLATVHLAACQWRVVGIPEQDTVDNILIQRRRDRGGVFSAQQYFGSPQAFFFRKLARKMDEDNRLIYRKPAHKTHE